MHVEITKQGETVVAVLEGEIDGKTAPEVQNQLAPVIADSRKIVLDMTRVTFLSSAGLRILLLLYRQASAKNGKVALAGLSEQIQDVMSITGFLNYFHIAKSVEEAIQVVA